MTGSWEYERYRRAKAEKESAYIQFNYAEQLIKNKTIMCRLAEIKSQHEPLATIIGESTATREKLIAACEYVVNGNLPEIEKEITE